MQRCPLIVSYKKQRKQNEKPTLADKTACPLSQRTTYTCIHESSSTFHLHLKSAVVNNALT